jgi:type II secretory pathway pseudopilin PulG
MRSGRQQRGFTYLAILFFVAVAGLGLAATGEFWSHARQREKEAELIWIGEQFRQAIGLYYQRSPGAAKRYPEKLEDLLEDRRFQTVQRYLRRIYPDPVTGAPDWGLVPAPGGGIMGVHSLSSVRPVRTARPGGSYREWQFIYEPPPGPTAASGSKTAR